jgi:hypothetical protein
VVVGRWVSWCVWRAVLRAWLVLEDGPAPLSSAPLGRVRSRLGQLRSELGQLRSELGEPRR